MHELGAALRKCPCINSLLASGQKLAIELKAIFINLLRNSLKVEALMPRLKLSLDRAAFSAVHNRAACAAGEAGGGAAGA